MALLHERLAGSSSLGFAVASARYALPCSLEASPLAAPPWQRRGFHRSTFGALHRDLWHPEQSELPRGLAEGVDPEARRSSRRARRQPAEASRTTRAGNRRSASARQAPARPSSGHSVAKDRRSPHPVAT